MPCSRCYGVLSLILPKMALEEYIRQVKETWTSYTLELVNYQNKCRLIRYAIKRRATLCSYLHCSQGMGRPLQQM